MKAYGCKRFQFDFERSARTFKKARRRAKSRVIDNKLARTNDRRAIEDALND